jgi:hypothetical protein
MEPRRLWKRYFKNSPIAVGKKNTYCADEKRGSDEKKGKTENLAFKSINEAKEEVKPGDC